MADSFNIPVPDFQVAYAEELLKARRDFLEEALRSTLESLEKEAPDVLEAEARQYVPVEGLEIMRSNGVRPEYAFCLPAVLRKTPRLLGYYRLLLGFSRKQFYSAKFGLSKTHYSKMEDENVLSEEIANDIPALCHALNQSALSLIQRISLTELLKDRSDSPRLTDLALMTYGSQLRGSSNVAIGQQAVRAVFEAIKKIVEGYIEEEDAGLLLVRDATGRKIRIRLGSDPDVELVTLGEKGAADTPLLAIEIKGGKDKANIHNRLGEAEKSHLKAQERGFTDRWTIVNVRGIPRDVLQRSSPSTTRFFDLSHIVAGEGEKYEEFRETLLQKLRLPAR